MLFISTTVRKSLYNIVNQWITFMYIGFVNIFKRKFISRIIIKGLNHKYRK